ncbi:Asp23/Gls24 family envelope stress response protein [Antribacter gilvus]|uniref:Asp23/Gls24 family envelope stress response protein n=1 Tax=Antribacter gilvus TaxID=2304675 RepID=UPI000F797CAE|nr:Asp23/Gls24 family envelope stress response protein [Antribacter gilvus]
MTEATQRTSSTPTAQTSGAGSAGAGSRSGTGTAGTTTIADVVVSKIAGMAAREVAGVHAVGGGAARAFGAIRERIPGGSTNYSQGVSVEVGQTEAAVDIELVADYGVAIADVAESVRRNVATSIERMTGLKVIEVNVTVNDVWLPEDDDKSSDERQQSQQQPRVQ